MQEYTCKADAAVTQANLLNTFNPTDGATAGTQQDGQSTVKLDVTGTALLLSLELLELQTIRQTMTIL